MANRVVPDRQGLIQIGKIKENLVTEVELPAPGFEGGSYAVLLRRPKEETAYPVSFRPEGGKLIWTVETADVAIAGTGKVECRWYGDNGEVAKSQTYLVRITDGLPDPTEAPEAWEGFMGQVARNAQAAQTAASKAETNANGAAASAGIAQSAASAAQEQANAAGSAANAAASAADAASAAQAGAESALEQARTAAAAAETAQSGAEAAKLAAAESATEAGSSARTAEEAARKGENLYSQIKADLDAGKLKGEKGDTGPQGESGKDGEDGTNGLDAPQIDDAVVSAETPWSSRKIVETLCPPIEETGNPVQCYPVAGYPLGAVASWEPTQAGSGEPYPAGGGPNLLDISKCTAALKNSAYGLTVTINGDVVGIAGTPTVTAESPRATFRILFSTQTITADYKAKAFVAKGKITRVTTIQSDKSIVVETPLSPDTPVDIKLRIMFYTDTEPTAYAPYENIRPISGRDAVQVVRCGENLLDITPFSKITKNGIEFEYIADGGIRIAGTSTASTDSPVFPVPILAPGKYYGLSTGNGIAASIVITRDGKRLWLDAKGSFEIRAGDVTHYWYVIVTKGTTVNKTVYPYIVPGSTPPTAYTPYRGDTYTLALPETAYGGGTVDAVTGAGQQTWGLVKLDGTEKARTYRTDEDTDTYHGFYVICNAQNVSPLRVAACSHFTSGYATSSGYRPNVFVMHDNGSFYVRTEIPGVTSVDTLKSYLAAQYAAGTPVQIAYKLAKPVAFEATGAAGEILPIPGEVNTIMTDADSLTVTGRADPIHIIQALQAAQSVATQQLAETQAAVVDTTAMAVDYIYEQDSQIFGGDEDDDETDTVLA